MKRVQRAQRRLVAPKRPQGRLSALAEAEYQERVREFCALILEIKSRIDFEVTSRGWCYLLEEHGLGKGDFEDAEILIGRCRKSGELPLDICAEDVTRETIGIEELDHSDIPAQVANWVDHLHNHAHESYTPISFWADQPVYVEVAVEKLDLRNLFQGVCAEFCVPITNSKGWGDINTRAAMMRRFKAHERAGRRCVLLLCYDHDPGGLLISDFMRKNLESVSRAVGWSPSNLVITPFGLNADFINANDLTWWRMAPRGLPSTPHQLPAQRSTEVRSLHRPVALAEQPPDRSARSLQALQSDHLAGAPHGPERERFHRSSSWCPRRCQQRGGRGCVTCGWKGPDAHKPGCEAVGRDSAEG
jgi:hypothetical protein